MSPKLERTILHGFCIAILFLLIYLCPTGMSKNSRGEPVYSFLNNTVHVVPYLTQHSYINGTLKSEVRKNLEFEFKKSGNYEIYISGNDNCLLSRSVQTISRPGSLWSTYFDQDVSLVSLVIQNDGNTNTGLIDMHRAPGR